MGGGGRGVKRLGEARGRGNCEYISAGKCLNGRLSGEGEGGGAHRVIEGFLCRLGDKAQALGPRRMD